MTEYSPAVSVCIPFYHGYDVIDRCVTSVLDQDGVDRDAIEIVISADAPSAVDAAVLRRVERDHDVVVQSQSTRLGLAGNWNKALSSATGRIRTVLHQHDWYEPRCLTSVLAAFDDDRELIGVSPAGIAHPEQGAPVPLARSTVGEFTGTELLDSMLGFVDVPAPSQMFLRASALEQMPVLYDERFQFCPEMDLYLRLAARHPDATFLMLSEPLVNRTAGPSQYQWSSWHFRLVDYATIFMEWVGDDAARLAAAVERRTHVRMLRALDRMFATADDPAAVRRKIEYVAASEDFWRFVEAEPLIRAEFLRRIARLADLHPAVGVRQLLSELRDLYEIDHPALRSAMARMDAGAASG